MDSHVNFYMNLKFSGEMNTFFTSVGCETGRAILKQNRTEEPGKFLFHSSIQGFRK